MATLTTLTLRLSGQPYGTVSYHISAPEAEAEARKFLAQYRGDTAITRRTTAAGCLLVHDHTADTAVITTEVLV